MPGFCSSNVQPEALTIFCVCAWCPDRSSDEKLVSLYIFSKTIIFVIIFHLNFID